MYICMSTLAAFLCILVPDNCKTAVIYNKGWYDQEVNNVYHEMAEHYNTAIILARIRVPKDKPNAEWSGGVIPTWITAALRNEQYFSLAELNQDIRKKLEEFVHRSIQKKEGSRYDTFHHEELPLLAKLPAVPYGFINRKVDVWVSDTVIEIFYNHHRIASHHRIYGRKGQYGTVTEHMPADHQKIRNGGRFRKWSERIGMNSCKVVNAILASQRVEQQSYRSCMGLLKLADKYPDLRLEAACKKALSYTASPSYKSIKDILVAGPDKSD